MQSVQFFVLYVTSLLCTHQQTSTAITDIKQSSQTSFCQRFVIVTNIQSSKGARCGEVVWLKMAFSSPITEWRRGLSASLSKGCFVCPNRGWRWAYHDATISHRDDAVNVGWPLLLPHRHWLQLTLCAGQSWPAVPPASLFHRTQIKEGGNSSFASTERKLCRGEGLVSMALEKELIRSQPS